MKARLYTIIGLSVLGYAPVNSQDFNFNLNLHPFEYQKIIGQYDYLRRSNQTNGYAGATTRGEFDGKSIEILSHGVGEKSKLVVAGKEDCRADYNQESQVISIYRGSDQIGSTKIKGYKLTPATSFSMNGKKLVALSGNSDKRIVYAYVFDLATEKWVVNGKSFKVSGDSQIAFGLVGATGTNDWIYGYMYWKGYGSHDIIGVNIRTGEIKQSNIEYLAYMYPSLTTNHMIFNGGNELFDLNDYEFVYSVPVSRIGRRHFSRFYTYDGKYISDLYDKPIVGNGVGFVFMPNSLFVFDTDRNYLEFSHSSLTKENKFGKKQRTVLDFVSFGDGEAIPPLDEPSYISLDRFNEEGLINILSIIAYEIDEEFSKEDNEGLNALIQIFDMAEPFDDEIMDKISITRKSKQQSIYFGARMVEFVNGASASELTNAEHTQSYLESDPKSANKRRSAMLQAYRAELGVIQGDEYARFLVDEEEVNMALDKLLPFTKDDYYLPTDDLLQKGHSLVLSNPLESITYYQIAADKEPNDPIIQNAIGNAYYTTGNYEKAMEYFNKSLALSPDNPLALIMIFRTIWEPIRTGKQEWTEIRAKALIASANRLIATKSENDKEDIEIAKKLRGAAQLYLDDKETYNNYNGAARFNTDTRAYALYGLWPKIAATGNTYFAAIVAGNIAYDFRIVAEENDNRLEEYILADEMYAKAAKVPEVISTKEYYAWANMRLFKLDQPEKAQEVLDIAKKTYPLDQNYTVLGGKVTIITGRKLYFQGSYNEAFPYLQESFSTSPEAESSISDMLGMCYYRKADYRNAVKYLDSFTKIEKENTIKAFYPNFDDVIAFAQNPSGKAPVVIDNRGKIAESNKRYEEGGKVFEAGNYEEGLKMKVDELDYLIEIDYHVGLGIAYNGVGVCYHKMGNHNEAIDCYRKSIKYGAKSQSSYVNLARIRLSLDVSKGVKEVLDEGKSKFPDSEDFDPLYDVYYSVYYTEVAIQALNKEEYGAAKSNANKAMEYYRGYGKAYAIYGLALYKELDDANAKKMLQRAVELDPSLRTRYSWVDEYLKALK